MTKILKNQLFLLIFIKFFLQKLKELFPISCLKFVKDYSEKILKQLLKK